MRKELSKTPIEEVNETVAIVTQTIRSLQSLQQEADNDGVTVSEDEAEPYLGTLQSQLETLKERVAAAAGCASLAKVQREYLIALCVDTCASWQKDVLEMPFLTEKDANAFCAMIEEVRAQSPAFQKTNAPPPALETPRPKDVHASLTHGRCEQPPQNLQAV